MNAGKLLSRRTSWRACASQFGVGCIGEPNGIRLPQAADNSLKEVRRSSLLTHVPGMCISTALRGGDLTADNGAGGYEVSPSTGHSELGRQAHCTGRTPGKHHNVRDGVNQIPTQLEGHTSGSSERALAPLSGCRKHLCGGPGLLVTRAGTITLKVAIRHINTALSPRCTTTLWMVLGSKYIYRAR
jgi:hypothetical protein